VDLVAHVEDPGDELHHGDVAVGTGRYDPWRGAVVDEPVGDKVAKALELAGVDGVEESARGAFGVGHCRLPPALE
jgi:hypothetical protein